LTPPAFLRPSGARDDDKSDLDRKLPCQNTASKPLTILEEQAYLSDLDKKPSASDRRKHSNRHKHSRSDKKRKKKKKSSEANVDNHASFEDNRGARSYTPITIWSPAGQLNDVSLEEEGKPPRISHI
jgi:hypothetical protein